MGNELIGFSCQDRAGFDDESASREPTIPDTGEGETGRRLFNVVINGEQVLTDFDIFAAAGAMSKAFVENFVVKPDENGIVSLQFVQGSADQPTVSGIELLRTDFDDADSDDAGATVVAGSSGGTTANIAINAGCVASSTQSCAAGTFIADADFAGGRSGSVSKFVDTSGVTNPAPEVSATLNSSHA